MSMTDPVADMLTRIRNAAQAGHDTVLIPTSGVKKELARVLKEEGYITDCSLIEEKGQGRIKIKLKYSGDRDPVIVKIKRESRPGLRIYVGKDDVPRVLNGLGIAILSTSKGVLTDRKARELGVGGEILCSVY